MQGTHRRGAAPARTRAYLLLAAAVVVIAVVAGVALSGGHASPSGKKAAGSGTTGTTKPAKVHLDPLFVSSSSPAAGAEDVASDSDISITFSSPLSLGSVRPTLTPAVAGTWVQHSPTMLEYDLSAPLIPSSQETVTIPSGSSGVRGNNGSSLSSATSFSFTVATGDELRLQELLADLDYLPLSFSPTGSTTVSGKDAAMSQPGSFAWRWSTLPTELTSQWTQGEANVITKAAVMTFENKNGLTVDGEAGPAVWAALLKADAAHQVDTSSYDYVLVTKVQPENLTLYSNGATVLSNILVNTGAPGADTTDGTFAVFEHVPSSRMQGTNPDGTKYDDPNVPWASYFNCGDALHGFVRAHYGFPQSNGCVEMPVANAALVYPYTPIGTLVTVMGPAVPAPPTTTTTTTSTTTTVPGAPTTTTPTTAPAPPT
jgi:peptidoglycan hydrolase-like protein with peptidoglycan-binding domain